MRPATATQVRDPASGSSRKVTAALPEAVDALRAFASETLLSLPNILDSGERVESLSLGAGNTPGGHDLVTDRRIAEFKFTRWRGA